MGWSELKKKLEWLDPFTYVDRFLMPRLNPNNNEALSWIVYIASAFVFAWLFYTVLGLVLGTGSPMVIVLSGSMEPLYHRGDVIVMQNANAENLLAPIVELDNESLVESPLDSFANAIYSEQNGVIQSLEFSGGQQLPITQQGDIVVYWSDLQQKPIIHRAVAKLHAQDGWYVLTKGDSEQNSSIDQDCGRIILGHPDKECITLYPIPVEKLEGKSSFSIPLVGCLKLWPLDNLISLITTNKLPEHFSLIHLL